MEKVLVRVRADGPVTAQAGQFKGHTHSAPTHVCVTVVGLGGVFGAAVQEPVGGRFRHSVGEMVDFHLHVATEGRREDKSQRDREVKPGNS